MAVKFSQFNVASSVSDIDYLVGYKSTDNIQIPVGLVGSNTTYTVATAQSGSNETLTLTGSDASTDVITFTAGTDITLTDDGAGNGFTIASTASGDTYTLGATTDGSNVDLNLDAAAGSDTTVQLTAGTGMTITQSGGNNVTFASAAGVTMTTSPAATGNGSTATYPLGATPTNENFTMAYISGVYQLKSSYTVSGSNITFDTNVPNGASIEIVTTT